MLPSQTQFFRLIPAEFLTTSHYIFGQVKVTNTGMIGVLSDLRTNYMEVKDANLARVQTPDVVINYSPLMWVVKDRLVAVCLNKREHIGPSPLQRGGYVNIAKYPVQITTTVYELEGFLEWAGRFEFSAFMAEGVNDFIIVYNAVLVSTQYPSLKIEKPAMLFHRSYLDTLVVSKKGIQEISPG